MKARPKPVKNALTGEDVPPDLDWLINRLAALNPPAAKDHRRVVDYHAHQVRGYYLACRWRGDRGDYAAIKITGRERPYAERVPAHRGTENELKRLQRAAKGKSDRRWQTAWLGVSSKTHSLIGWPPLPPVITRVDSTGKLVRERADIDVSHRRVSVRGLHAIMPTRADAVPLIEAALAKLEAIPAAERRKRERDTHADDAVRAVAVAYCDLTGERRGLFWDEMRGLYRGGLLDLGRAIEARFGDAGLFSVRHIKNNF